MSTSDYEAFLRQKFDFHADYGFDVDPVDLSPCLLPHQRDIVQWAIKGGRRALFESFGLGKSVQQLEILRLIVAHLAAKGERARALIVCPLGVKQEFARDARELLGTTITFLRRSEEVGGDGLYLTNYESIRDGRLDPELFDAVSLDEASVLRSYGSKTYQSFLGLFAGTKYRFVATATPSPNRYKELIHYAGFLGVMDTGAALTRWFRRDSTHANNLTLHPHKEAEFFVWLHSWAIFLQRPSDLGYSDEGYDLPDLEVVWHELPNQPGEGGHERDGQGRLYRDAALGVSEAAREKRDTLGVRVAKAKEIVDSSPDDHFILWHDLETERAALKAAMPEVVEVFGNLDIDAREERIIGFSEGEFRLLATKPTLSGSGCNFQRFCHRQIFVGVGFKFNDFIQAVHRCHRYLQPYPVRIDVIYAESEREVVKTLRRKWAQHKELTAQMSDLIRKHGLDQVSIAKALERSLGIERVEMSGEGWLLANNDCVLEVRDLMKRPGPSGLSPEMDRVLEAEGLAEHVPLPAESVIGESGVDLIVTSIPFGNQYEYVASYNDFGHTDDNGHFWEQMDFLTPELLNILRPGRIYACHVKDRILFGNVTGAGYSTVSPFHAEALMHGLKHGFEFVGMITVVTDVVRENNQSYRLGWSEMAKDGTKMGVGSPEYVLLFRKPQSDRSRGYADVPVVKDKETYSRARWQVDAHAFWRSSGDRPLAAEDMRGLTTGQRMKLFQEWSLANVHDHEVHVSIGEELDGKAGMGVLPATFMMLAPPSPHPDVWTDVNRMRTLNTEQSRRDLVMHTCLARDSLVLTRGGHKPIQEIVVGEHVLTHKGRWRPVVAVQNTGVRPVLTVKAQGVPGLTLTPDHKLWTRPVRDLPWARSHSRREATKAEPTWVPAEDTVGSYINLKLPPTEAPSVSDPRHWWTVGRWLADGHFGGAGKRDAIISCGRHETDGLVDALGSYAGKPRDSGTAMQILLRDPGHELRRTLKACGEGASGKHLPPEAFTLPFMQAYPLLAGYLSGDGHYLASRNRYTASSVSRELLLGMAFLAQRVYGAVASIYPGRPPGTCVIEGRTVTTKADWVMCFDVPDEDRKKGLPFVLDDGAWKKVRAAEPAGEVETWNLRVAEDESYTAEGCVVKNCPLQYDIVDRLIERYSNPGELVFDPFAGLGTVPLRALRAGRRGRGVELNPASFIDSVRYLKAEEMRVGTPSLFDLIEMEATEPVEVSA